MVEEDLGQATIVYEGPDGETVERTVENEHVAYFQDHWVVKTGENEAGHDTIRRIPAVRVYHVERDVEEFEREVGTVYDEFQSVAEEFGRGVGSLRSELGSVVEEVEATIAGKGRTDEHRADEEPDVYRIDIETGEPAGDDGPDRTTSEAGGGPDLEDGDDDEDPGRASGESDRGPDHEPGPDEDDEGDE